MGRLTAVLCQSRFCWLIVPPEETLLLRNHIWKVAGKHWKLVSERSVMNRLLVGSVFPGKAQIDRGD